MNKIKYWHVAIIVAAVLQSSACESETVNLGHLPPPADTVVQPDTNVTLIGKLTIPGGYFVTDVWGYVDSVTGKEYALMGAAGGSSKFNIVDVSNPSNPVLAAVIDTAPSFDIKTWRHYAYAVNGGYTGLGKVIDLSNPLSPVVAGSFPSAHNIWIDSNGYMYTEYSGLRIYNLNSNPINPPQIYNSGDFDGHDAAVIGNRLYDFHGNTGTRIFDITTPSQPALLSTITDPAIIYHHSGWTDTSGHYLYICDELAQSYSKDITIWDITSNPQKVGSIDVAQSTVHNLYVIGKYAYVSYYAVGLRVYDISNPVLPVLAGAFDTNPITGNGYQGAFGVYPFLPSGNILVSDMTNGLFILRFNP